MICKSDIANLKTEIAENVGQKIIVKGSLGRSKQYEKEATIEKVYPSFFGIKYEDDNKNDTCTYIDVLIRKVEVSLYDGKKYNPIVPSNEDNKEIPNVY